MPGTPEKNAKWHHPSEVMKLHTLKLKKKKLQARINGSTSETNTKTENKSTFENVFSAKKRKNPFANNQGNKKIKPIELEDESSDRTLFKLLHQNSPTTNDSFTNFNDLFRKIQSNEGSTSAVEIVKAQCETWLPIDWSLKTKIRMLSEKPFPWNQKLKISEEASGITGFSRCLDTNCDTKLDMSPNAKFHQCCLYWQQPSLPWIQLFPRTKPTNKNTAGLPTNAIIKDSLQAAWSDSLKSLFQLIRTRQCPYFYACANNFTVLFRAAGICGYADVHALITPTTRGFRNALRHEEIEFTMPLKTNRFSDLGAPDEQEAPDEQWMKDIGVNKDDIKQINYVQEKLNQKAECDVDNSEQSLILVKGADVHALYNFLINCKTATATTGHLAGVPPTLLAPVAFNGATLNSLKVRDNKVHLDDMDYYSLDISGPILPTMAHNFFLINCPEHSVTMTFNNLQSTDPFSKVKMDTDESGSVVFGKENLSDCGLKGKVLEHFCNPCDTSVANVECLKFISENKTFTWT